ncbi:MAG TPA: NAD(P)H-dependent glycerol-3-phosphate dehydrogenase [Rhodopila sp.]|uniref:NAD(P)H-dependent glycerol-3-phosphate dehydrogenase n=1 Tax=Rhodopila sp. TaxID=2480087 RepID=UPI002BE4F6BF|nr:NAD(P)H-dependent glycerol-3-phosphate dehydrogenase [Rhodopila sp.]HVY16279.1 NAD(P)H-dependent glycerol-3-phosphate dehydrogenase [Rhodopila sp.]
MSDHVTVVGAGAWGTALAIQAHRAGRMVTLVARPAAAAAIAVSRTNARLPGITLPAGIRVADGMPDAGDLVLWVAPMQHLRDSLRTHRPTGVPVVVCAKGVERQTDRLPLEVLAEVAPDCPGAILSGPNFAHEIALGLPAASVVAAADAALRDRIAATLSTGTFRLYGNDDPVGAQLGGAAKNVIAIAAGAVIGAGLGENARAALVTRGLAELRRLVAAVGGKAETVMGLSGLGDLLLTCTGPSSRNFAFGHALGRGQGVAETLAASAGVVEGASTAEALLARAGAVELPICRAVADVIAGRCSLAEAMQALLSRPRRDE